MCVLTVVVHGVLCEVGADTIKVLLQTQSHTNPVYSGMVDATKKTIQAEGLSGLYKGVASPLAGTGPLEKCCTSRASPTPVWCAIEVVTPP